jgi:hypothetical protein
MSEIIESVPWACGERDCSAGWHLATYWIDDDGTFTVDSYSDGDHDEIDRPPTCREIATAWLAYWTEVLETGSDPLHQLRSRTVDKTRTWQIRIANSIIGPVLHSVRPATKDGDHFHGRGGWFYGSEIPSHVADYMLFEHREKSSRYWTVIPDYQHKNDPHGFARYLEVVRDAAATSDDVTDPRPSPRTTGVHFFALISHKVTLPPTATTVRKIARKAISDWTLLRDEDPPCIRCGAPESACECGPKEV